MGARNGVTAAIMVQVGFSGVWDVLEGEHNVLEALSPSPKPSEMDKDLGDRFFVTETAIKPYPVGYPIQSALDAFFALHQQHRLTVENVERITVRLPEDGARIVNNRRCRTSTASTIAVFWSTARLPPPALTSACRNQGAGGEGTSESSG
jgi:2-methylcitrate dehydratase PrpD